MGDSAITEAPAADNKSLVVAGTHAGAGAVTDKRRPNGLYPPRPPRGRLTRGMIGEVARGPRLSADRAWRSRTPWPLRRGPGDGPQRGLRCSSSGGSCATTQPGTWSSPSGSASTMWICPVFDLDMGAVQPPQRGDRPSAYQGGSQSAFGEDGLPLCLAMGQSDERADDRRHLRSLTRPAGCVRRRLSVED